MQRSHGIYIHGTYGLYNLLQCHVFNRDTSIVVQASGLLRHASLMSRGSHKNIILITF